jgi:hypothetical protein
MVLVCVKALNNWMWSCTLVRAALSISLAERVGTNIFSKQLGFDIFNKID